jgi:hypothetical protein
VRLLCVYCAFIVRLLSVNSACIVRKLCVIFKRLQSYNIFLISTRIGTKKSPLMQNINGDAAEPLVSGVACN